MPTDLTGTPTSLGIGTYNVDADAPSGLGFNAAMGQIDALIAARATVASPAFTGTPTAPTPAGGDVSTKIATTSFVSSAITNALSSGGFAPLASPAFTGTPTAPTPVTADNTTKIATTAFVKAQGYLTSAPVTSVATKTGAVTLVASDVSNAADKSSGSEQDFTSVVQAPNFYGVGPTSSSAPSGGTYTPQAGSMTNWVQSAITQTFTIANPAGVAGGTSKVAVMAITYTNGTGSSGIPSITWGSAYRFAGMPSTPGSMNPGDSYTWLFLINMPQSRVICLGASQGAWT